MARADGFFGFEEWRFGTEEQCWFPVGRYSCAIIDTLENAEIEVPMFAEFEVLRVKKPG